MKYFSIIVDNIQSKTWKMTDTINQTSLILEPNESEMNIFYMKARETFITIANACIDNNQSVTSQFEVELNRRHDLGEIEETVFQILWWNMETILAQYRRCLGVKVKGDKTIKERAISKLEMEKEIDCAICLDKHAKKEGSFIYSCKHEFGKSCLEEWIKLHKSCPLCRSDAKNVYGFKERKSKEKK